VSKRRDAIETKSAAPLLISTGDPAGLGPEICMKTLRDLGPTPGFKIVPVGHFETLEEAAELVGYRAALAKQTSWDDLRDLGSNDEILHVEMDEPVPRAQESAAAGRHTYQILSTCARLCLEGRALGVVTCPINKASMTKAGYGRQGHTELLAGIAGVRAVDTVFCVGRLKIFFLSRHVSLRDAISQVDKDHVLAALVRIDRWMKGMGYPEPRLGVPGLNPHGGEGGIFGREEIDAILPAVEEAKGRGIHAEGPIGADSIYHLGLEGRFDAILSLYHDQGHIASKTYDFYGTVTLSLGLPFVRTSVDHGTGFDIAWKGLGNPESLVRAVYLAMEVIGRQPSPCLRELKIDRAVYLVDDKTKTYRFLRRNPDWKELPSEVNETNKKTIDGYTRVLRSGQTKTYKRADHP
jgi:4-phospho-D-threonate 3-dehydrogenase / 4-phospho-D-erythronate 3-dehydrogenase